LMWRNLSDDTLTAMVRSVHILPSMQALRSTQLPSSMISPLCSAMAMNSLGGISPRVGCVKVQIYSVISLEIAQFELR
jgi:hypothetical protein